MRWLAYGAVWLTFAFVWTLAGANSSGQPVRETLPYGLLAMGTAAAFGVAIWRITARVGPDWRTPRFYAVHATGLCMFCVLYSVSWMWPDVLTGRASRALAQLRGSPVLLWNALMASWLYLMMAGIAYAIRAQGRLRAEEAAAAEARLQARQAQLTALRAQVNPHFLFNALHSIGALVAIDPSRADRALERLGDMLRYALSADEEVPLGQEWRFTRDYLAIEQLRLGDRLRVEAEVDDAATAVLVPPLILQPLVENAVRHGIADRADGGRIRISAGLRGDRLHLRVADDGPGRGPGPGGGIGMESVRRRLSARYGDAASLRVDNGSAGFDVTIALPAMLE